MTLFGVQLLRWVSVVVVCLGRRRVLCGHVTARAHVVCFTSVNANDQCRPKFFLGKGRYSVFPEKILFQFCINVTQDGSCPPSLYIRVVEHVCYARSSIKSVYYKVVLLSVIIRRIVVGLRSRLTQEWVQGINDIYINCLRKNIWGPDVKLYYICGPDVKFYLQVG